MTYTNVIAPKEFKELSKKFKAARRTNGNAENQKNKLGALINIHEYREASNSFVIINSIVKYGKNQSFCLDQIQAPSDIFPIFRRLISEMGSAREAIDLDSLLCSIYNYKGWSIDIQ